MKFDKLKVVKFVASGIVGMGTQKIVGDIIKNNVTAPKNVLSKVGVVAASWVISAVIVQATKGFTDELIDDTVKTVNDQIDKIKTAEKLVRINKGVSTFEVEDLDQSFFRKEKGKWVPISEEDRASNLGLDDKTPANEA